MAKTEQEIFNEIIAHIRNQGGHFSSWYCGITEDIQTRLFGDHKVPRKNHWFIYRQCANNIAARNVENALIAEGCDGGPGGGDFDAIYVYAYLKNQITNP